MRSTAPLFTGTRRLSSAGSAAATFESSEAVGDFYVVQKRFGSPPEAKHN